MNGGFPVSFRAVIRLMAVLIYDANMSSARYIMMNYTGRRYRAGPAPRQRLIVEYDCYRSISIGSLYL